MGKFNFRKAKIYNNEHLVGRAVRECGVAREELFIVTKLYPEDMGYDKCLKAFEKSCKQLQVDYVGKFFCRVIFQIYFTGLT